MARVMAFGPVRPHAVLDGEFLHSDSCEIHSIFDYAVAMIAFGNIG
jgi:hypothetical protein